MSRRLQRGGLTSEEEACVRAPDLNAVSRLVH
jgi:hypothetical protein